MPVTRSVGGKSNSTRHSAVVQTLKSKDAEKFPNTEDDRQVILETVSCFGSHASSKSSRSNARAHLMLAELKEKQLKSEMDIEAKELEVQRRLLKAKNEVELARLSVSLGAEQDENLFDNNPPDNRSHVENYIRECQCRDEEALPGVPYGERSGDNFALEIGNSVRLALQPVVDGLELPRVELFSFEGDPVEYWTFIKQFEWHVEKKVSGDDQRLLHLLHYCKGPAKRAIKECAMLPPCEGYVRARNILKGLFGQPHHIARSMIEELMKWDKFASSSTEALSGLAIQMENCSIALKQMDEGTGMNSAETLEKIVRSLPKSLQYKWADFADMVTNGSREPGFDDLTNFISTQARIARSRYGQVAEERERNFRSSERPITVKPPNRKESFKFSTFYASNNIGESGTLSCPVCQGQHAVDICPDFMTLSVDNRWNIVKKLGACFKCFRSGHKASTCRSRGRCGVDDCQAQHHNLLHNVVPVQSKVLEDGKRVYCAASLAPHHRVLLGIIPIRLVGPKGYCETYAFLDSGSDTTLIREEVVQQLCLQSTPTSVSINTLNGVSQIQSNCTAFSISDLEGLESIKVDCAFSVPHLPISAPVVSVASEARKWPHLHGIPFHEKTEYQVDVLIGCDVPEAHWVMEQRIGNRKQPYAIRTLLGWVMFGPSSSGSKPPLSVYYLSQDQPSLVDQFCKLYDKEFNDLPSSGQSLSVEDKRALNIASKTIVSSDGHFEVPVPWKHGVVNLPNNYIMALKRLLHLKKKFERDPTLFLRYSEIIKHYLERGYVEKVSEEQYPKHLSLCWYLPHHPVQTISKPGKIRVVFDCAARFKGTSLNDKLCQGPDLTTNLVGVLLRFRRGAIAVAADIEEMFMQIRIPSADRGAFRFLWWPNHDIKQSPIEYQMVSHPFGATSSPFCANYALRRAGVEFGSDYSQTTRESLNSDFYVDDCLKALPNTEEAIIFVSEICAVLSRAGFRLRKWVSNSREVLESIEVAARASSLVNISLDALPVQRALGINWDAEKDEFQMTIDLPERPITRRGMLSCVSSLFDPLGFVAPWLLPGKCLLQSLCKSGFGWDEEIGLKEQRSWKSWLTALRDLNSIRVPRCMLPAEDVDLEKTELHLFCDASETAYGVVAYACFTTCSGKRHCSMIFGKARVAPLKPITIPRLELVAALLAVRVRNCIVDNLPSLFNSIYMWTDSMIVLHYIYNVSSRFCTFVANRLTEIHESTRPGQWQHVSSEDNPADLASRGLLNTDKAMLWLTGPEFLQFPQASWPRKPAQPLEPAGVELKRPSVNVHMMERHCNLHNLLSYYSDWTKLRRAVAWLCRFKQWCLSKFSSRTRCQVFTGPLQIKELHDAKIDIIKMVQHETFGVQLCHLMRETNINHDRRHRASKSCPLRKLCPVMIDGVMCVGGRLGHTSYDTFKKHPMILPNKHPVVDLIVRHIHTLEGHCGTAHAVNMIRRDIWIVHGGNAAKRIIGKCLVCRKRMAVSCEQQMAPLPKSRAEPGWYPFEHVGVDYFGPMFVKRGRGTEKRFGCLFTCLKTRAVHLEVAHDLSTDAFINTLIRFIGRRGCPTDIYSDNGTNFVGATRELRECIGKWDQWKISNQTAERAIQWHFNPPASSHRGGIWERIVRSVRRHLVGVCEEQTMSDDTLATVFIEVERILNNRPLVPPSNDSRDDLPLTPNDLLIVRGSGLELVVDDIKERYARRWKQVSSVANTFWKRWISEYIPTLQARQRWLLPRRDLKVGDLVLVTNENCQRGEWPLGLVQNCETSEDGLVRAVSIKTTSGVLRRDVRKVCRLEGG